MTFIVSPARLNDGQASNRPEFPTMDGKADRMIAGRQ